MDAARLLARLMDLTRRRGWRGGGFGVAMASILLAGFARAADAPESAVYTFTNTSGKTVQAQVVNVDNDTVYFKRADGKTFEVAISTLVDENQAYIRGWAVQQALAAGTPVFEISTTPSKGPKTTANDQVHWGEGFKVKLTNQTMLHLLNATVDYIVFSLNLDASTMKTNGSAPVPEMPANAATTFTTQPVNVTQYGAGPGQHQVANEPTGIWIRIYDSRRQLVQEWSQPADLMKNETWTNTGRGGMGRGRGGMGGYSRAAAGNGGN
jgi:hypothetical protein